MNKEKLMRKIQALSFAKTETELYLDAHPNNPAALDYYKKIVGELEGLYVEYENKYGPITASGSTGNTWNWISGPWPWHREFETEDK